MSCSRSARTLATACRMSNSQAPPDVPLPRKRRSSACRQTPVHPVSITRFPLRRFSRGWVRKDGNLLTETGCTVPTSQDVAGLPPELRRRRSGALAEAARLVAPSLYYTILYYAILCYTILRYTILAQHTDTKAARPAWPLVVAARAASASASPVVMFISYRHGMHRL